MITKVITIVSMHITRDFINLELFLKCRNFLFCNLSGENVEITRKVFIK